MDTNIEAALIGVAGAGGIGCLAWFCKRFLRWPFGEAYSPDARATVHVGHRLTKLEADVSLLQDNVATLTTNIGVVRREREEGEQKILGAINEHALVSAEAMGSLREDIGNLFGLLGRRAAKRPRRPRPKS